MNTKISEVLNIFIRISGERYNIFDMLEDLKRIDKHIPEITDRLTKLRNTMTDEKYFDASSEIIDRNIELSLQKKLNHLNNKLNNLREQNANITAVQKDDNENYLNLNLSLN